jgi:hypothetical protein
MRHRIAVVVFAVGVLAIPALAMPCQDFLAFAQAASPSTSPIPLPPQLEKELAARASNVSEVTLDKNMLGFASKFMDNKDKNQAGVSNLIQGLDGIYVRDYEFDKEGQYSMDEIEKLRQAIETPEWQPLVRDREHKGAEMTDVMVKIVNGETRGMFILSAEPKELSIVLILGDIRMDQLGMLKGISGLGALGAVGEVSGGQSSKQAQKQAEKQSEKQSKKQSEGTNP